jgi:D-tyrosyl-tRNA(Tyr) deacylase
MRVVIQRVLNASIEINKSIYASINQGLLVLLSIEDSDNSEDIEWLTGKIARLRIFSDSEGVMNCSVSDINGEILLVSQFTLHASTKRGNRPSYIRASGPDVALPLYEKFIERLKNQSGLTIKTGIFGADMRINLLNDGPVTILIDTKNRE